MSKITAYSPDTTPSLDDLIVTVDIGNGNKKVTLQDLADAIAPSIGTTLESNGGWVEETELPDTITYNGNRSYDVAFNSTDLTDTLSEGMKLRLTRTVSAPTQCADLEASSSQYFNKTSPNKMTFTDDFVCSAWVKLESYTQGTIISRYNGTSGWVMELNSSGQVYLLGYNAGAGNVSYVQSYQSVPLAKWIHIAAQLDMSAFTATTTTSYIMINGVDVPAAVQRGGTNPTALVQAGNLEIGATNGGTVPFDGKIAQVAVFNAKVTQATMRTYMSQGLSGSETSLASAYSLSNSITDLNTTTPNDLTAQGSAVATNVDSPFGNYLGGTLDYAIITKTAFSTNTTLTVQVPEGCTIPTSGGVSAVAYSTQASPYGCPAISNIIAQTQIMASSIYSTSTSDVDINGATCTAYIPANRKVKISIIGSDYEQSGGIGTHYGAIKIKDGSTVLANSAVTPSTANFPNHYKTEYYGFLSEGNHTFKMAVANNSTGPSFTIGSSTVAPIFLTVELV